MHDLKHSSATALQDNKGSAKVLSEAIVTLEKERKADLFTSLGG